MKNEKAVLRRLSPLVASACALTLLLGCYSSTPAGTVHPSDETGLSLSGAKTVTASYYGGNDGFHGNRTASGERFDPGELTAAHRSYPFGTKLKVTNPKTKQSVYVTVNDRGPWRKGRDIDLSYEAAKRIGLINQGYGKVVVEEVK